MSVGSQPISNGSARTSCFWQSVSAEPKQSARAKAAQRPRPWRFGRLSWAVRLCSHPRPCPCRLLCLDPSLSLTTPPQEHPARPLFLTSALPFRGGYRNTPVRGCYLAPSGLAELSVPLRASTSAHLSPPPPLLLLLLLPAEPRLTSTRLAPPAEAPVRWPPLSTLRRVDTHCLSSGPTIQFDHPRPPLFSCTCTAAWDARSCASHPRPRRPPRSSAAACQ